MAMATLNAIKGTCIPLGRYLTELMSHLLLRSPDEC